MSKFIFLIRGLPGSGKTTLSSWLNVDVRCSADDFFLKNGVYDFDKSQLGKAHYHCQQITEKAMICGHSIAIHNTFTTEKEMEPYFELAEQYGYKVSTIIMENRHGSENVHNVPLKTIKQMKERFNIKLTSSNFDDLVSKKTKGDLTLLKYKRKVFYNNLWDLEPKLMDARGTVIDKSGKLIQYPFTKVFNYKENGTVIDLENDVLAIDKINGFMAAATIYNNEVLITTTGSFDSDFVEMAKQKLPIRRLKELMNPGLTYIFEIVHENDPHIIRTKPGAYLLGARTKIYGSRYIIGSTIESIAKDFGVMYPHYKNIKFKDLLEEVKWYNGEGFVVYDSVTPTVLKIKTPFYLVTKFIGRCRDLDKVFSNYKQNLDEEFYPLCEYLINNFSKEEFASLDEQVKIKVVTNFLEKNYFN